MAYDYSTVLPGPESGRVALLRTGKHVQFANTYEPFSPAHFAAAEKLLRDHQQKEAERDIKEVFRSPYLTVFRRDRDGAESVAFESLSDDWSWIARWGKPESNRGRPEAEAAAKKALMEAKS